MIDLLGHIAYATITLGLLWLGQQKARGWIMKAMGDAGWAVLGIALGMSSIFVWASLFVVFDLIGWQKWRQTSAASELENELLREEL